MHQKIDLASAADWVNTQLRGQKPDCSIVLGSGLGDLETGYSTEFCMPYKDIPGMPICTAPEHAGVLRVVKNRDQRLVFFHGRFHLYEGYGAREAASTVYLSRLLGCHTLISLQAAGALNAGFKPGELMLVEDHLNFSGRSPLQGANNEAMGVRFPDLSQVYTPTLRTIAVQCAKQLTLPLQRGIYAGVMGPELETSAERRFYRSAGADAIGMSLVMEAIAAAHCGLDLLALSAITNLATGGADQQVDTIEEVLANAAVAAKKLAKLLPSVLDKAGLMSMP